MSDIELVIRISEEKYKDIQGRDWKNGKKWFSEEWQAIHNGTILPKGHGRLIDADALEGCRQIQIVSCGNGKYVEVMTYYQNDIDVAPTIIEADTESEEV